MLTRREITLLLFCLIVFVISYNVDSTKKKLKSLSGADWHTTLEQATSAMDLLKSGRPKAFAEDGRRVFELQDELELEIMGDWEPLRPVEFDLGPSGRTARQFKLEWGSYLPLTSVLSHIPGYTAIDSVYIANSTIYLVSDDPASFPDLKYVMSNPEKPAESARPSELQIISFEEARDKFGEYGSRISGTTWMVSGKTDNYDKHLFMSLYRFHSFFYPPTDASLSPPTPPDRTFFIHTKKESLHASTSTAPKSLGYDFNLARTLLPYTGNLYQEDWNDFASTGKAVYLDRVLLVDWQAAKRGMKDGFEFGSVRADAPESVVSVGNGTTGGTKKVVKLQFSKTDLNMERDIGLGLAPPFAVPTRTDWWTIMRDRLLDYLSISPSALPQINTITYISSQRRDSGPRLVDEANMRIANELEKIAKSLKHAGKGGWKFEVVDLGLEEDGRRSWTEHVKAIVNSAVVISLSGDSLSNAIFLETSSTRKPLVIEIFPEGKFSNDNEFICRVLGIEYMGWQGKQKIDASTKISPPDYNARIRIAPDVSAIIKAVKSHLSKW